MEFLVQVWVNSRQSLKLLFGLALWVAPATASFASEPYSEQELKSAYIFNFLKFVEWPSGSQPSTDADAIRICAYSEDPLLPYLKQLEKRTVRNKSISLTVYDSEADTDQCQLIYVNQVPPSKRRSILNSVKGKAVITVGNEGRYADEDEMITFFTEDKKLRFDINFRQVRESGIEMSSRLLKLARISEQ